MSLGVPGCLQVSASVFRVSAGVCWCMQVSAGVCGCLQVSAGVCRVSVGVCGYLRESGKKYLKN